MFLKNRMIRMDVANAYFVVEDFEKYCLNDHKRNKLSCCISILIRTIWPIIGFTEIFKKLHHFVAMVRFSLTLSISAVLSKIVFCINKINLYVVNTFIL